MQSWKPRIDLDTNQHRWLHDSFKKTIYDEGTWHHCVRKSNFWEFLPRVMGVRSKKITLFTKRDRNIVLNAEGDVFLFLQQQKRLVNSVDADLEQTIEFVHFGLDLWRQQSRCAKWANQPTTRKTFSKRHPSSVGQSLWRRERRYWKVHCSNVWFAVNFARMSRKSDSLSRDVENLNRIFTESWGVRPHKRASYALNPSFPSSHTLLDNLESQIVVTATLRPRHIYSFVYSKTCAFRAAHVNSQNDFFCNSAL